MLIKPSIDNLLKKVENKYTLVVLAAKRGRELRTAELEKEENKDKFITNQKVRSLKEVTSGLNEINEGLISFKTGSTKVD